MKPLTLTSGERQQLARLLKELTAEECPECYAVGQGKTSHSAECDIGNWIDRLGKDDGPLSHLPEIPGTNGVRINDQQGLYVIPAGDGYTCLGFDVMTDHQTKLAAWMSDGRFSPFHPRGSGEAYLHYTQALLRGERYSLDRGMKCPILLESRLIGHEGKRCMVTDKEGLRRSFRIGRSTGWMPVHLELESKSADGGGQVHLNEDDVVVIQ